MCAPYWAIGLRCGSTGIPSIASASIGSKNNIAKASKAAIIHIVSFGFSILKFYPHLDKFCLKLFFITSKFAIGELIHYSVELPIAEVV